MSALPLAHTSMGNSEVTEEEAPWNSCRMKSQDRSTRYRALQPPLAWARLHEFPSFASVAPSQAHPTLTVPGYPMQPCSRGTWPLQVPLGTGQGMNIQSEQSFSCGFLRKHVDFHTPAWLTCKKLTTTGSKDTTTAQLFLSLIQHSSAHFHESDRRPSNTKEDRPYSPACRESCMLLLVDFRKDRKVELPGHGHVSSGTEVGNFIFHVLAEF